MKITIVGTGYVGLVTGTCFAEIGVDVTCVDIDEDKIQNLNKGIVPIYEPGLDEMLKRNYQKGRLHFTINLLPSLKDCEVVFIAVGTPPGKDGSADLKYVLSVGQQIGKYMENYVVIVNKSTVPVGTAVKMRETIKHELNNRGVEYEFDVVSNPEFLKEGAAISDFLKPDRIIIGVNSERAEKIMKKLYNPFVLNSHPILYMDVASSEMTKYAANCMLATKISFMNDIANLCEILGADVNMVRKGIGSDSRIGEKFIYPGIGYGGSCFPKDVKALIKIGDAKNYSMRILSAVESVNDNQKTILFKKVSKYFDGKLKDKIIALWGLAFKPHTDDMRDAPSLVLIEKFLNAGARIKAYDPAAMEVAEKIFRGKIELSNDQYEAVVDADCLLLVTEWPEFRVPSFKKVHQLLKRKVIFDGRNIFSSDQLRELGFEYYCIGV